jgi:predicted transcriptional regulator
VQFQQNAPGHKKGSRLVVGEGGNPPTQLAHRFEVYRPVQFTLAVGDRVRITAGGKTKDGKHRLSNGTLLTVEGFTKRGDIIVDGGWVIDRDFGHLTHGYVLTSHASQGDTVDKVFVAIGSQSLSATNQRTGYVALTRGREEAVLFTDDRKELLRAISRPDEPLSATELAESTNGKASMRDQLAKSLALARRLATSVFRPTAERSSTTDRGLKHER